MNKYKITRTIIETAVSKILHDIEKDLERNVRNIVEICSSLSNGRFQKSFFNTIEDLLQNEESAYYTLAKNAVSNINHEHIKCFGINIGYNSCMLGAEKIRKNEEKLHYNIPWSVAISYGGAENELTPYDIDNIISQGKKLGVYIYIIYIAGENISVPFEILKKHKECAFAVFLNGSAVDEKTADEFAVCYNTMACISTEENGFADAVDLLKTRKVLYGIYTNYNEQTYHSILSNEWIERVSPYTDTFAFLINRGVANNEICDKIKEYVNETRNEQKYPLFLMELNSDILFIDNIISDESCSIAFNENGHLISREKAKILDMYNIKHMNLCEILKRITPRKAKKACYL